MIILASNGGSFLICVPRVSGLRPRERFRTVGRAAVRIAEMLGADIEVSQRRNLLSVWVYYKNEEREWSPVYFDWGKSWGENEVFNAIRSELYRLRLPHNSLVLPSPQVRWNRKVICCLRLFSAKGVGLFSTKVLSWSHRSRSLSFTTADAQDAERNCLLNL